MAKSGVIGAWAAALSVLAAGAVQAAADPIQAAFVVLGDGGRAGPVGAEGGGGGADDGRAVDAAAGHA